MSGVSVRVSLNNGVSVRTIDTEEDACRFVAAYGERNLVDWINENDGDPEQRTCLALLAEAAAYLPADGVLTLP